MDNEKQDEVEIKTEDIEIGQSGTVTVNVTSTTTATVSNPMEVVFVIDQEVCKEQMQKTW